MIKYLLLGGILLLSACGAQQPASTTSAADFKPKMNVKMDISGTQLTVKVETDLHISPEHYGDARKSGEGHIHMYLDNGEKIGVTTGERVFKDLTPGPHTLKVSLHNNDHTPYDVTQTYDFTIK